MRTTTLATLAALTAVTLGALSGCAGGDADAGRSVQAGPPEPSRPAATVSPAGTPAARPGAYDSYVALGDSYTAAPLVPKTDISNGCLRSNGNYPAAVAAALPKATMVDVSCSGADTADLTGPQQTGGEQQPPQLDAVSRGTDLVTLGIGGNDFNLFATLVRGCSELRASDPGGAPCREHFSPRGPDSGPDSGSNGGADQLSRTLPQIRDHVAEALVEIHRRAPRARVLLVGYPQIMPAHGTCPRRLPLADGDVPFARRVNVGLEAALRSAVHRAHQDGVRRARFVDVFRATAGHDICSDEPWVNGRATDPQRALAFHPFAEEQQVVADRVLAAL